MKFKQIACLLAGLLPLTVLAQPTPGNRPMGRPPGMPPGMMPSGRPLVPVAMPDKDKLSYAIGMNVGGNIKRTDLDVDVDTIAAGIKDILGGKTTRLSEREASEVLSQLNRALSYRRNLEIEENKTKAEKFMATNATASGVKVLPSGLQYKVMKEGTGEMPKDNDKVVVSYRGTLLDGKEFDRNENFTNDVKRGIIRGWQEALPLMKTGSKWTLYIPPELAYGPRGAGAKIPPNSALIFDIELLHVIPGPTPVAPAPSATPVSITPRANYNRPSGAPPSPPGANTPVVSGEIIKVPSAEELKRGAKIEVIKPGQTN